MTAAALKALKGSIKKWEKIVAGKGIDDRSYNCPLCHVFPDCMGCPVQMKADNILCGDTPWENWSLHHWEKHFCPDRPMKVECPTCLRLAKAELAFLKRLLPKGES